MQIGSYSALISISLTTTKIRREVNVLLAWNLLGTFFKILIRYQMAAAKFFLCTFNMDFLHTVQSATIRGYLWRYWRKSWQHLAMKIKSQLIKVHLNGALDISGLGILPWRWLRMFFISSWMFTALKMLLLLRVLSNWAVLRFLCVGVQGSSLVNVYK